MCRFPFPQFSKIDVLGENAIPLYKWLSENTKFEGFGSCLYKIEAAIAHSG